MYYPADYVRDVLLTLYTLHLNSQTSQPPQSVASFLNTSLPPLSTPSRLVARSSLVQHPYLTSPDFTSSAFIKQHGPSFATAAPRTRTDPPRTIRGRLSPLELDINPWTVLLLGRARRTRAGHERATSGLCCSEVRYGGEARGSSSVSGVDEELSWRSYRCRSVVPGPGT